MMLIRIIEISPALLRDSFTATGYSYVSKPAGGVTRGECNGSSLFPESTFLAGGLESTGWPDPLGEVAEGT